MPSTKLKQSVFALLTIFLWAAAYVAVRFCSEDFSPFGLTSLRMFASALMILCMLPFHRVKKPALRDLPLFLLSALCAYSLYSFLMSMGAQTITASVSSFITAFSPVLVPVFALFFLREHMSALRWLSVGIGGLGVVLMLFGSGGLAIEAGVLWVLAAATLFALYNIIQRNLLRRYDSFTVTAYSTILGAVTLFPFLPAAVHDMSTAPPSASVIVFLLGASSAIAYLFWAMALKLTKDTAQVTNFMFLTPLLTTLLGFLTMGELPPLSAILGGLLMLLALLLTNIEPKKARTVPSETPPMDADEEPLPLPNKDALPL